MSIWILNADDVVLIVLMKLRQFSKPLPCMVPVWKVTHTISEQDLARDLKCVCGMCRLSRMICGALPELANIFLPGPVSGLPETTPEVHV